MLGWLKDITQVGLCTVAANLALLTIFLLDAANSAVAPRWQSYMQNEKK